MKVTSYLVILVSNYIRPYSNIGILIQLALELIDGINLPSSKAVLCVDS